MRTGRQSLTGRVRRQHEQASLAAQAHFDALHGSPGLLDSFELSALATKTRTAAPAALPAASAALATSPRPVTTAGIATPAAVAPEAPAAGPPSPLLRRRRQQQQLAETQGLLAAPPCAEQPEGGPGATPPSQLPEQTLPPHGAAPGSRRGSAVRSSLAELAVAEVRRLSGPSPAAPARSPLQQSIMAGGHLEAAIRASPGLLTDSELHRLSSPPQQLAPQQEADPQAAGPPVAVAQPQPSQQQQQPPQQPRQSRVPKSGSNRRPLASSRSGGNGRQRAPACAAAAAKSRTGGLPRVALLHFPPAAADAGARKPGQQQHSAPGPHPPGAPLPRSCRAAPPCSGAAFGVLLLLLLLLTHRVSIRMLSKSFNS